MGLVGVQGVDRTGLSSPGPHTSVSGTSSGRRSAESGTTGSSLQTHGRRHMRKTLTESGFLPRVGYRVWSRTPVHVGDREGRQLHLGALTPWLRVPTRGTTCGSSRPLCSGPTPRVSTRVDPGTSGPSSVRTDSRWTTGGLDTGSSSWVRRLSLDRTGGTHVGKVPEVLLCVYPSYDPQDFPGGQELLWCRGAPT